MTEENTTPPTSILSRVNWGNCVGPLCKIYSQRCSWNYCYECCTKIHSNVTEVTHTHVWSRRAPVTADARLPVMYGGPAAAAAQPVVPPKPAVPEPTTLQETTDNLEGDWTLAKETATYFTYGY